MSFKLQTLWRQGIIQQDRTNGDIVIKQGVNVVIVHQDEKDMFLEDIEAVPYLPAQNPSPGTGGGLFPLPDKKPKMNDLLDNLLYVGKGWKIQKK